MPARVPFPQLDYPMSVGVFDRYEQAQKAVDTLTEREFPVQQLEIVGTDLRQVERVTGRLTLGRALAAGAGSGLWIGLLVGVVFELFSRDGTLPKLLGTVALGAVFGAVFGGLGYALARGRRDFTSVQTVVATRYELLCEHTHAEQARLLLADPRPIGEQPRP